MKVYEEERERERVACWNTCHVSGRWVDTMKTLPSGEPRTLQEVMKSLRVTKVALQQQQHKVSGQTCFWF